MNLKDLTSLKKKDLPRLARAILEHYFRHQTLPRPKKLAPFLQKPRACFVSLHTTTGDLRGCIGTFLPTKNSLWEEMLSNTLQAAFEDPRFPPLQEKELPQIKFSVDLLSPLKEASFKDLDPRRKGLLVKTPDGRGGLLLPNLPGVKSAEEQLAICLQKGGIMPEENYSLYVFETERYEEE